MIAHLTVMSADRFQSFSTEHLLLIGFFLVGCVAIAVLGRSLRGRPTEKRFRIGFAIAIPIFTMPLQIGQLLPGDFTLGTSLPLQICDLAWMVATFALLTGNRRATQVLYFWGLTLVVQAIVTPSLEQGFPDPRWFMFWGMHFLTVWAAVYLTFGIGLRPTWSGFRLTVACTLVWVGFVMIFNALTDTNYGYLNRKPAVASPLDWLGPWPGYVVAEIVAVAIIWALITWPWQRSGRGARSTSSEDAAAPATT